MERLVMLAYGHLYASDKELVLAYRHTKVCELAGFERL